MASALYRLGVEHMMNGELDLDTDTISVVFARTSAYTFSQAHEDFADLAGVVGDDDGALYTDGVQLASKTTDVDQPGLFDAADSTFLTLDAGAALDCLIVYKEGAAAGSSWLLCYIDGISIVPNGGNIVVNWAAPVAGATYGIFQLVA